MSDELVYLDYAASTPLDPSIAAAMSALAQDQTAFANPASTHLAGQRAAERVDEAAASLASLLGCSLDEIIWTSGATESNNLAIIGGAMQRQHRGRHIISMKTEHKAVTDVLGYLSGDGFEVTWLAPDEHGLASAAELAAAIRDDTQLVSIMHMNNETGHVQDIAALGAACRARSVPFHVDAAQSAGKLPIDVRSMNVDLLSLTSHKMYGPSGIGALFVSRNPECHIEPILYGGGQQRRLRPGSLPVPQIVGLGLAAELAAKSMKTDQSQLRILHDRLWEGIRDLPGVVLNGSDRDGFPGILNVSIDDIDGESLLLALEPLCVARGSACNAANQESSGVLRELGLSDEMAQGAIRFSFGRPTATTDIDAAISQYRSAVAKLRAIATGNAA